MKIESPGKPRNINWSMPFFPPESLDEATSSMLHRIAKLPSEVIQVDTVVFIVPDYYFSAIQKFAAEEGNHEYNEAFSFFTSKPTVAITYEQVEEIIYKHISPQIPLNVDLSGLSGKFVSITNQIFLASNLVFSDSIFSLKKDLLVNTIARGVFKKIYYEYLYFYPDPSRIDPLKNMFDILNCHFKYINIPIADKYKKAFSDIKPQTIFDLFIDPEVIEYEFWAQLAFPIIKPNDSEEKVRLLMQAKKEIHEVIKSKPQGNLVLELHENLTKEAEEKAKEYIERYKALT